jgi:uncharacterized membrane protein
VPDKSNLPEADTDDLPDALSQLDWQAIPEREREILQTVIHAKFEMIRSPLLPPRLLREYNDVVPGLAQKLVEWTETESEHRRGMEKKAFEETRKLQSRGQWIGGAVSIIGLCFAALIGYLSPTASSATVAVIIAIVSVGGPFAARLLASRFYQEKSSEE